VIGQRVIGQRDIGERVIEERIIRERDIGETVANCGFNQQLRIHIHIRGVSSCIRFSWS
jgi:hypothetical protein